MKLVNIVQILYFCLIALFISCIVLFQSFPQESININILLIFTIVLLPLWDALWSYISYKEIGTLFFITALVVFCYVAMYLVMGLQKQAESLSIIAYYLLVAGVATEIILPLIFTKKLGKSPQL